MVDIIVWAHVPGPSSGFGRGEGGDVSGPVDLPDAVLTARAEIRRFIEERGWQATAAPADEPYTYASVPKREIMSLAEHRQVGRLFHDDQAYELDLANSIVAAQSDAVATAGYAGKGHPRGRARERS